MDNELTIKVIEQLSKLNSNMETCLSTIADHETRLRKVETNGTSSLKSDIVALLVKALTVSVVCIASLTGASAIVGKIFGL